jgi:hypothetical protein
MRSDKIEHSLFPLTEINRGAPEEPQKPLPSPPSASINVNHSTERTPGDMLVQGSSTETIYPTGPKVDFSHMIFGMHLPA